MGGEFSAAKDKAIEDYVWPSFSWFNVGMRPVYISIWQQCVGSIINHGGQLHRASHAIH